MIQHTILTAALVDSFSGQQLMLDRKAALGVGSFRLSLTVDLGPTVNKYCTFELLYRKLVQGPLSSGSRYYRQN